MRRLRGRGAAVPPSVRASLGRGERLLAAAEAADGTWLVGTRDRLLAVPADGHAGEVRAVPWERVQRAEWDDDAATLTVERVVDYGEPVDVCAYELREPAALLQLVRERVTASVLLQRRVEVHRKRGFAVIARRPPGGGGSITWAWQFDPGIDPDDPDVRASAERALAEARESLGR